MCSLFFSHAPPPPELYTLSLHDALPISPPHRTSAAPTPSTSRRRAREARTRMKVSPARPRPAWSPTAGPVPARPPRSEEHTSELQSRRDLVCRLLLEKKKKK